MEVLVVAAIVSVLAGIAIPSYRMYIASRAPADAAQTLTSDLALLERLAQVGERDEGASLMIVSTDPLVYRGYRGRPASLDPNSKLGVMVMERRFAGVRLAGGPIGVTTPLLIATDGTVQYVASGMLSDPHTTLDMTLSERPSGTSAHVTVDLLTGALSHS